MLPNTRLLARTFHRAPRRQYSPSKYTAHLRQISSSPSLMKKWEGSQPKDHITNEPEPDSHNVRHDAHKEGQEEKRKGDGSRGVSEQSGDSNRKAKEEFPEAPDTIGMQDERGGKA